MSEQRLLIVDDETDMLDGLKRVLELDLESQVTVDVESNPVTAVERVAEGIYDLVLLDIRMPEMDGLDALKAMKEADPWVTVVMMTAYGSIDTAVTAIKRGAYDFITKPFDKEELLRCLHKALERNRLIRENRELRRRVEGTAKPTLVGRSLPMRRLHEQIQMVARTDYTVLIRGQSGTGKELVARSLHAAGRRAHKPLVTVNCPAIPEHLLESELFGHVKGAFTGADRHQDGLFKEAHGGTIFLDEIGDIPVAVQTKLLRVLQEGEIRPLGASRPIRVDVRVIASTNQDLEKKIAERSFREDLYYRLNVVTIWTPSLDDMRDDIPLLVNHFARQSCEELGCPVRVFSVEALEALAQRPWPGNVRELQNFVRRVIMFSSGKTIRLEDIHKAENLPPGGRGKPVSRDPVFLPNKDGIKPYKEAKDQVLETFTRRYVRELLQITGGNVTRAAELSGLSRGALQKIMRRIGIRSEDVRNASPSPSFFRSS